MIFSVFQRFRRGFSHFWMIFGSRRKDVSCRGCSAVVKSDSNFCRHCGFAIKARCTQRTLGLWCVYDISWLFMVFCRVLLEFFNDFQ